MVSSNHRSSWSYDYIDKLLRLEKIKLFSRKDKILDILDATILILYRKLCINIVSIIVLNIEASQYNIKINLAICPGLSIIKTGATRAAGGPGRFNALH